MDEHAHPYMVKNNDKETQIMPRKHKIVLIL